MYRDVISISASNFEVLTYAISEIMEFYNGSAVDCRLINFTLVGYDYGAMLELSSDTEIINKLDKKFYNLDGTEINPRNPRILDI